MIKAFVKQNLDINKPTNYIYKLAVMRNELEDLERDFRRDFEYCVGCQEYSKIDEASEVVEDGRIVLRCHKCNSVLRFKDLDMAKE